MADFTLTADQQKTIVDLLKKTTKLQQGVTDVNAALTATTTSRDSCYADTKTALTELGYSPPGTVTEVHFQLGTDSLWTGKVYVNSPAVNSIPA